MGWLSKEIEGTTKKQRCSREQSMCVCLDTQMCLGVYEINPRGAVGPERPWASAPAGAGPAPLWVGPGSLVPCECRCGGLLNLTAPQLPQPLSKGV